MVENDPFGIRDFVSAYPLMALRPSGNGKVILKGRFDFCACDPRHGEVSDSFSLRIEVPHTFPRDLPVVFDVDGRIPLADDGSFHINRNTRSLCLGSPVRLLLKLSEAPTLLGFAERLLVPYLYAISRKLSAGGSLVFDELEHGSRGLLDDYSKLFGSDERGAVAALRILGLKKRIGNKNACPCGCGKRVGRCKFNRRLATFRRIASRSWYRGQLELLRSLRSRERSP